MGVSRPGGQGNAKGRRLARAFGPPLVSTHMSATIPGHSSDSHEDTSASVGPQSPMAAPGRGAARSVLQAALVRDTKAVDALNRRTGSRRSSHRQEAVRRGPQYQGVGNEPHLHGGHIEVPRLVSRSGPPRSLADDSGPAAGAPHEILKGLELLLVRHLNFPAHPALQAISLWVIALSRRNEPGERGTQWPPKPTATPPEGTNRQPRGQARHAGFHTNPLGGAWSRRTAKLPGNGVSSAGGRTAFPPRVLPAVVVMQHPGQTARPE